jgi:hypothetical protein
MVFVITVNLNDVADLATKRRSSETPKNKHERPRSGALTDMEVVRSIECDKSRIGRIIAYDQCPAMHVRQGIAHHPVGVLGASRHDREADEHGEQEHKNYTGRPFPEPSHA